VPVQVLRVNVVRAGNQCPEDNRVTRIGFNQRGRGIAMRGAAEQSSRVSAASGEGIRPQADGPAAGSTRPRKRVVVLQERHRLAEAATDIGRNHRSGIRVDVGDGTAPYLLPAVRVVVRRPGRLGHDGAGQAMPPGVQGIDVVVEIRRPELDVPIPAHIRSK